MKKWNSRAIGAQQKKRFLAVAGCLLGAVVVFLACSGEDAPAPVQKEAPKVDKISPTVDPQAVRIGELEKANDALGENLKAVETALAKAEEEHQEELDEEKNRAEAEARRIREEMGRIEKRLEQELASIASKESEPKAKAKALQGWEMPLSQEERSVAFEIPAGTVLKAVVVSGIDCSVGINKPAGENLVLLRPLDDGRLPRNIRVPLKGSMIICNADADISTERVRMRGERLTLVQKNGSFVETEITAYVAGEDGRAGLRGVVVDRSGQIVMRAAFSGFLQGVGQTAEALFSKKNDPTDRTANATAIGVGGSTVAMGKLTDYYIKRAEQLQPAIQIAAGRIVDVVFTKAVKVGEKDLKKKLDLQRKLRQEKP